MRAFVMSRIGVLGLLLAVTVPASGRGRLPCDAAYPSDSTISWDCIGIAQGQSLESLCGEAWPDVARFNRMDRRHAWPGVSIRMPRRLEDVATLQPLPQRYEAADSLERFMLLDLTEQFLGAYEHGVLAFSLPATSGRPGFETPVGDFAVDFADPRHTSSKYEMEGTDEPYPMDWALRFHREPERSRVLDPRSGPPRVSGVARLCRADRGVDAKACLRSPGKSPHRGCASPVHMGGRRGEVRTHPTRLAADHRPGAGSADDGPVA